MKTKRILLTMATLVATTVLSAPPAPPPAVPSTPAPAPGAKPALPSGVVAIPAAPEPGSQRTLPSGVVAVPAAPVPKVTPGPAGPAAPVIVTPAPVPAATPAPAATQQAATVAPQLPPGTWIGSITADKVNARGRATVHSHAVFSFNMNEPVLVLGEVTLSTPKAGDERKWLRIQVPENVGLFVHKNFVINIRPMQVPGPNGQPINIKVGEVKASRLNVRAGAGMKFPKLGSIPKGASVILTDRLAQGDWLEIVAPETTEVFVAAQYVVRYQGQGPRTLGATPGVAISKPVAVPDPTSARFIPGTGQPVAVPTPPRPERPKPVEIISIPIGALGQSQPGANDPNEAFPAPPIPVKRSRPTAPKKGPGQPKQPSGAGKEPGKIISSLRASKPTPTSNPKPEVNAKPTPEKVEVKGAKPPTPAAPTPPVKPAENSKPPQPEGSAKPNETSKVKPAKTPRPVEVAKVKPNESMKPTETAKPTKPTEQNKVAAKPVQPVTKPAKAAKPEKKKPVRIVTREGYVQRTLNIQSPTPYVLEHLVNGKVINYLYLDHPKLPLKLLRGRRVLITGEEAIDPRWLDTPVLKIQTLKTIDDAEILQDK